jgi:nuclear polyadenylated RNA-binding protein 3
MPVESDPPSADTIVVGGDSFDEEDDSMADDDESLNAYSEDDDGVEPAGEPEPDHGLDEYAKTFDSPGEDGAADGAAQEHSEAHQDVSNGSDSMIRHSAFADNPAESPVASLSTVSSSSSSTSPSPNAVATDTTAQASQAVATHAGEMLSVAPAVAPAPTAIQSDALSQVAPPPEVRHDPNPVDSVGKPTQSADEIDIQKLVDDITAKAAATSSLPSQEAPQLPAPVYATVPPTAIGSGQSSLPPKPSLSLNANQAQHVDHRSPQSAIPSGDAFAPPPISAAAPHPIPSEPPPAYPGFGAPGTAPDMAHTLPPPPSASFGGPQPYLQVQGYHNPGQLQAPHYPGQTVDQAYETFLQDERRYTHEANWSRFPDGSRIFIGASSSPTSYHT